MMTLALLLGSSLGLPLLEPAPDHAGNPVLAAIVREGFDLGGQKVRLPPPLLSDGQPADQQRAALLQLAGSERALSDLLRDSVTAPFILKVHDQKVHEGTVRLVDLWFVVRGELEGIEPREFAARTSGKSAGAGNMTFENRLLGAEELKQRDRSPVAQRDLSRWFVHVDGRLLDRIEVASTSEVAASRTAESVVIASRTDRAFDAPGAFANHWNELPRAGADSDHVYQGGISYARIGRLQQPAGALLVELHAAFIEPHAWFQGAPILRSKFAPIAQDQVRRLRRELQKERLKTPQ